jgi:hypothetical protein
VVNIDHSRRPLVLGYVRHELAGSAGELETVEHHLSRYAARNGYHLGRVFIEPAANSLSAFEGLVAAVERYGATAVVVPTMLHLAMLRPPAAIKTHFEYLTGARVLPAVEYSP